jgi:NADPH:quinone reductase-like Zn-dependent oxidoreductase
MTKTILASAILALSALVTTSALAARIPTEQRAIVQTGSGGPEVLKLQSIPVLEPGEGQVLVEIYAAGVNPVDWKIREGFGRPPGASASVPGFDIAGVIVKVGAAVTGLRVGEAVFGRVGPVAEGLNGGYAHYAVVPATNVIPKPTRLTFAQAAGLGVAGGTAERMIERTQVSAGQRVLITGVAGGVGSSAAQIAKAKGAYVIGTASARHGEYLKSIGVDQIIDYTQGNVAAAVTGVDVVLDTVGGDALRQTLAALKKGGILQSVAGSAPADQCAATAVTCIDNGPPGPSDRPYDQLLEEIARLVDAGKFTIHVDRTFSLNQAAAAQEYNRQGHTEGKVILSVEASKANTK